LKLTTTGCVTPLFAKAGNSLSESMNVKVFPNPSESNFNLQLLSSENKQATVTVMDVQGRMVEKFIMSSNDISSFGTKLKAGVYFVQVSEGGKVKTLRVVKY
jgi:hypothetical protein